MSEFSYAHSEHLCVSKESGPLIIPDSLQPSEIAEMCIRLFDRTSMYRIKSIAKIQYMVGLDLPDQLVDAESIFQDVALKVWSATRNGLPLPSLHDASDEDELQNKKDAVFIAYVNTSLHRAIRAYVQRNRNVSQVSRNSSDHTAVDMSSAHELLSLQERTDFLDICRELCLMDVSSYDVITDPASIRLMKLCALLRDIRETGTNRALSERYRVALMHVLSDIDPNTTAMLLGSTVDKVCLYRFRGLEWLKSRIGQLTLLSV